MNARTNGFSARTGLALCILLGMGCAVLALLSHGDTGLAASGSSTGGTVARTTAESAVSSLEREAQTDAECSGFYKAPAGQVLRFAFSVASKFEMRAEDKSQATDLQVRLRGTMTVMVVDRRGDELLARVNFTMADATAGHVGQESPLADNDPVVLALTTPTLVHMRDCGTTIGYGFADSVGAEHRNWFRAIWSAHRFVARDVAGAAWTTREDDVVGTAVAEYRWTKPFLSGDTVTGGHLQKTKRGYETTGSHTKASVVGAGEAHLNPGIGWLETARMEETTTATIDEIGIATSSTFAAEWSLQEVDWQLVSEDPATLWPRACHPVCGHHEQPEANANREAARHRARLAGATLEQLCGDLAAMIAAGTIDSPEGYGKKVDLTWLLRLDPEALRRAIGMLPALSVEVGALLLSAIGATELPAAQAMLANLFSDPVQHATLRQAAAWAMVQVQAPGTEVVQRFGAALLGATSLDAGVAAGVLALGTMAGRIAAADRPAAMAMLLQLESAAIQQGAVVNWLEALGNAGQVEGLAVALRYQHDDDASVRAAAVSVVRSVGDRAALQVILDGIDDGDAMVRARAAEVLSRRTESVSLPRLSRLLDDEADARVRMAAVGALAGRVREPAVRAMLQRRADNDTDAEVRNLASSVLHRSKGF